MSFLDRIRACNAHDFRAYRPFEVDGIRIGWIRHALAEELPDVDPGFVVTPERVTLAPEVRDFEARSMVLEHAAEYVVEKGLARKLRGEFYPVLPKWGAEPLLRVDRAVVAHFGVAAYGLHVNGFVRTAKGIEMWVGRRARDRGVAPGQFDNLIAGGQPIGLSLAENLIKEAAEEAGIGPDLIGQAVPVGAVTYLMESDFGLKPDTLFLYDLELDADFVPENTDGEVEGFERWPLDKVAESVRDTLDWKFNVNLVVIDFLVRHGWLKPEEPDYLEIVHGLRRSAA
jgi:8-oxo-dGTP pyrophosphatase MutT (NUDIX family)